ncbi:serine-rich adhesin for platelets-like [Haliotis rufescens]|uniref:serine-rich adhesin for platelets-like n=1 Tax=Haliotis rufescens TaxID=6454 RepID=UPI001EB07195|nr:serine-rich adhesin for platelets-like [Haliotis rufescens]XP_046372161.1 serine-rich adhesin for platelets-like [Haliotis rufescens]
MMYPDDPCLGIPIESWSASSLPVSPSSSSSSLNDLAPSLSNQFLPSSCSSRTSCSEVSFDLDPTPSSSELSQLSGRSYHGSPEASFLYPDYPSFVFGSSLFRVTPDSSSASLSPRCIESCSDLSLSYSDDKLSQTTSSTSLVSVHPSESIICISSSESVISISSSESVISITSSHSVISVASSSSCDEASAQAFTNPSQPSPSLPVNLQTLFYHDLPYYQWTSFSNPASPSISFTDLLLPATSVSCSETPLTEIPCCSSSNYSPVTGSMLVIRDVADRKRKRDDGGDDDDDDGLPLKRQCQ